MILFSSRKKVRSKLFVIIRFPASRLFKISFSSSMATILKIRNLRDRNTLKISLKNRPVNSSIKDRFQDMEMVFSGREKYVPRLFKRIYKAERAIIENSLG